ncbi:pirin family protein [Alcaligenes endophyticus]|uniref:Pirin family protein n=1 Tax=Alcaligenes endophyticus TaxID=1929088 RepID=A0ABT8EME5_9BURK|nr:pirin-like bicupin family protein [Alcaligenes endophyticus]MCX5590947.1 pirin family protein [Alcaligenes endophyticus]MDN4122476.1 pirin family protein [Alcaligenes endophyticus]
MIIRRPFNQLGAANHGWLDAKHHFSFASYHDPNHMGWGALRVWNDDTIAAGAGFPPHSHANMEIITYVREGAISHQDSLGNKGRTLAGDVQVMSAGTGIRHAEYNLEQTTTRIFQIWILPDEEGLAPSWGTKPFSSTKGQFTILASGYSQDSQALPIRVRARVMGARLDAGETINYTLGADKLGYLVPAQGEIRINDILIQERDGAAIKDEHTLHIVAMTDAELVFVETLA